MWPLTMTLTLDFQGQIEIHDCIPGMGWPIDTSDIRDEVFLP